MFYQDVNTIFGDCNSFQRVPSLGGVEMIGKYLKGKEEYFYFVFRVLIGFLFFQHGAQKLFGLFGGKPGFKAFVSQIRKPTLPSGRPGVMPPISKEVLSDQEAWDLYQFIVHVMECPPVK